MPECEKCPIKKDCGYIQSLESFKGLPDEIKIKCPLIMSFFMVFPLMTEVKRVSDQQTKIKEAEEK